MSGRSVAAPIDIPGSSAARESDSISPTIGRRPGGSLEALSTRPQSVANARNSQPSSSANRRASTSFTPTYIRGTIAVSSSPSSARSPPVIQSRQRTLSNQSRTLGLQAKTPVPLTQSVPSVGRPAYLEFSALRDHLFLEGTIASDAPNAGQGLAGGELGREFPSRRSRGWSGAGSRKRSESVHREESLGSTYGHDIAPNSNVLHLPSRWSDEDHYQHVVLSPDGKEMRFDGPGNPAEKEAAAARANFPIPPACGIYYYEVQILDKGSKGHISIGFSAPDVRLSRLPGWERHSWGYHGDDGRSFASQQDGSPYGPKFTTGDTVGCGIDFSRKQAFYTKNGRFLGMVFNILDYEQLYPSVGLRTPGEIIRANFGDAPFVFDIESHVQQQRTRVWQGITSLNVQSEEQGEGGSGNDRIFRLLVPPKSTSTVETANIGESARNSNHDLTTPLNELIVEYLSHHGYAQTAQAIRRQDLSKGMTPDTAQEQPGVMDVERPLGFPLNSRNEGFAAFDSDTTNRQRIVQAILIGDIDTAITDIRSHFPSILQADASFSLLLFKLRCRKFVELLLEAAQALKVYKMESSRRAGGHSPQRSAESTLPGLKTSELMDVDQQRGSIIGGSVERLGSSGQSVVRTQAAQRSHDVLNGALSYGQSLQADFGQDPRSSVQAIFKRTFSLVAYENPYDHPQSGELVGQQARVELANEVDRAILESQGRPVIPLLEKGYRQASAVITELGILGIGLAAFVDTERELLLQSPGALDVHVP